MKKFHQQYQKIDWSLLLEKSSQEIGNWMDYAHIIQKIANTCGNQAALYYDGKFGKWKDEDSTVCPWQINVKLSHESVVIGLDYKLQNTKSSPFLDRQNTKTVFP